MFEIGDLVRGTKESDGQYEITNSAMTKGIVVDIGPRGNILVRVLQHQCGVHGMHCVKPEYFEKIGHAEPFEAAKFQEALSKGKDKAVEYLLSADLSYADLRHAYLRHANLSGADLDFSCFPLWCGGMNIKSDVRIARQLAYHFCRLDCENEEYIDARNALVQFANGFHRVQECGQLAFRSKSQKVK